MQPVRQSHRDFAFNFVTVHSYLVPVTDFADASREFDTLKSKKVPQSLEIGLFFVKFIFII